MGNEYFRREMSAFLVSVCIESEWMGRRIACGKVYTTVFQNVCTKFNTPAVFEIPGWPASLPKVGISVILLGGGWWCIGSSYMLIFPIFEVTKYFYTCFIHSITSLWSFCRNKLSNVLFCCVASHGSLCWLQVVPLWLCVCACVLTCMFRWKLCLNFNMALNRFNCVVSIFCAV